MLPKKHRLKKQNDFKKIFEKGYFFSQDFLRLKLIRNEFNFSRFAFAVGLKISKKAVIRNKVKRRLSEIVRLNFGRIKKGFDVVIIPAPGITQKTYQEIEKTLIEIIRKAGLIEE